MKLATAAATLLPLVLVQSTSTGSTASQQQPHIQQLRHLQDVIALEPTPCQDWQANQAAFEAATAKWTLTNPPCYDFSYKFLGFQIGLPAFRKVQVRNGVIDESTSEGTRDVPHFFNMIQELCVADCPASGAETCRMEYDDTYGYPTSIFIDVSRYMADEERIYQIADFALVDCSDNNDNAGVAVDDNAPGSNLVDDGGDNDSDNDNDNNENPTETEPRCADYEASLAAMQQALDQWSNPACYDFVYERTTTTTTKIQRSSSTTTSTTTPVQVQVRHGVARNNEMSIPDFMQLIQTDCLDQCRQEAAATTTTSGVLPMDNYYQCTVVYDEQGYPVSIDMDPTTSTTSTTTTSTSSSAQNAPGHHVRISNLTVMDCNDDNDDETDTTTSTTPGDDNDKNDTNNDPVDNDPTKENPVDDATKNDPTVVGAASGAGRPLYSSLAILLAAVVVGCCLVKNKTNKQIDTCVCACVIVTLWVAVFNSTGWTCTLE